MGCLECSNPRPTRESLGVELLRVYFARTRFHPLRWWGRYGLKLGTNLIGMYDILSIIIWDIINPFGARSIMEDKCTTVSYFEENYTASFVITYIVRGILIAATVIMFYGNNTGKIKCMVPYVFTSFCYMWTVGWVEFSATICNATRGEYFDAIATFMLYGFSVGAGTFILHTVLCRILEIKNYIPKKPDIHGDQEDPAVDAQTVAHGESPRIPSPDTKPTNPLSVTTPMNG